MTGKIHYIRFDAPFKDGNLFAMLVEAGHVPGTVPGTIKQGSAAWVSDRLAQMTRNSGASFVIEESRLVIPPSTRLEPEPEPEELEPLELEHLNLSAGAYKFAKEKGIHPIEFLETIPEFQAQGGVDLDHKFTLTDAKAIWEAYEKTQQE